MQSQLVNQPVINKNSLIMQFSILHTKQVKECNYFIPVISQTDGVTCRDVVYRFLQLNSATLQLNSSRLQLNSSRLQLNSSLLQLNSSLLQLNSSVTRMAAGANMKT